MDVRCEKCMTVYEFDDSKVGEQGVTVKCTTCGHVFKVKKQWWAQALDDGFAAPSATFHVGGKSVHANAAGKAHVAAGRGTASAPGYVGASFRAP